LINVDPNFWLSKNVLITGHTGFKGTWLSIWLQMMGANVSGISLNPLYEPSLFYESGIENSIRSYISDIRDHKAMKSFIQDINPEVVIHMAAQPLVRDSYENPIKTYETNVMGTISILESIRDLQNIRAFINVTTDKCYENNEWCWGYRETDALGGHDPYSASKACSEIITKSYERSFFHNMQIGVATVRAGNVIGGGDWSKDRLIPDVLYSLQKKESLIIRNPNSTRPWQHVLEPLAGYLILAERLYLENSSFSGAWNFGPNDSDARPVSWIVERMSEKWGCEPNYLFDNKENPHEANFLKLDISKSKNFLQWEPRWSIDNSLDKVIEWHKEWIEGKDIRKLCEEQIKSFLNTNNKVFNKINSQ